MAKLKDISSALLSTGLLLAAPLAIFIGNPQPAAAKTWACKKLGVGCPQSIPGTSSNPKPSTPPVSPGTVFRGNGYVKADLPDTGSQNDNWSCGPNSAARLLRFYGHNVDYNQVRSAVDKEYMLPASIKKPWGGRVDIRTGTTPHVLRDVMKRWEGDKVKLERKADFGKLMSLLREGKPVIALLRVGSIPPSVTLSGTWPAMHWVAVTGFNEQNKLIYYTDTNSQKYQMSYDDFMGQWNWSVGQGFASEALWKNGVQTKTIVWVDRIPS